MQFASSVLLVILSGLKVLDASFLSEVEGKIDDLSLASRREIYAGNIPLVQTILDILSKLGKLEEKIDKLNSNKELCGNGWIKYGGSCYYFSIKDEKYSWPDALLQCRAVGGYLAEVKDEEENDFIKDQAQLFGSALVSSADKCQSSFLTGVNKIPDFALSASSSASGSYHVPARSRLNTIATSQLRGAWAAGSNDQLQWIQADLQRVVEVTGVVTQGRQEHNQWVKKFAVYYSPDCLSWTPVTQSDGSEQLFTGNTNRNTPATNMFTQPLLARCIRIKPREWFSHISTRFDVLGCSLGLSDGPGIDLWLGGSDIWHESDFKWVTSGTRIAYDVFHDWNPRQPDNAGNSQHCLMINSVKGWHDAPCAVPIRFVCEKPYE